MNGPRVGNGARAAAAYRSPPGNRGGTAASAPHAEGHHAAAHAAACPATATHVGDACGNGVINPGVGGSRHAKELEIVEANRPLVGLEPRPARYGNGIGGVDIPSTRLDGSPGPNLHFDLAAANLHLDRVPSGALQGHAVRG